MKTISPEEVGLSSERLNRINLAMQKYVDQGQLSGIITLVARQNKIAHFNVIGKRDIESNLPMEANTIFRIYSMTKPIVSIAMMMLYEEGRFHLTDSVSDYIPQFENLKVLVKQGYDGLELTDPARPMTIRDLFIHTAGLSYGFHGDSIIDHMYRKNQVLSRDITLEEMIRRIAEIPLVHHPGTYWRYSVATDVLGYLVQVISGQTLESYLAEKIFAPLGMTETGFHVPAEIAHRFASNYGPCEDGTIEVIDKATESAYLSPPQCASGGGGLVSTTADYFNFCQMLLNQGRFDGTQLVSKKTMELMTCNHLTPNLMPIHIGNNLIHGYGFGLGFSVMVDTAQAQILASQGSYGWAGAAYTHFWIDPQEELVGLFMTQFMQSEYKAVPDFRVATYQSIIE
ncbi:MAG: serine hydrolase domain-containing protein [Chloroflexota bacterium]